MLGIGDRIEITHGHWICYEAGDTGIITRRGWKNKGDEGIAWMVDFEPGKLNTHGGEYYVPVYRMKEKRG